MEELTPSMVFDAAKISPVNGFVMRPVNPAIAPFRAPIPPYSRWPCSGCSTTPVKPLFTLCASSLSPIFKPIPKLSALMFLLSIRCFMNYRSKVSSLTPLPIVPMILLKLLLVPATIEPKKGTKPPLFLPASNSLANCEGLPRMLSPEAIPTNDYIVYILLMPLTCFCLSGVDIYTGERWMCASYTSTMLSPTLESNLLVFSVMSEILFLMHSFISMPLIPSELRW